MTGPRKVRPLRERVLVRRDRAREELARGGTGLLKLIADYRARKSPRLTHAARPDFWPAKVLAVGELPVTVDLKPGDDVLVYTYRDNPGERATKDSLYTGDPSGVRDEVFVHPDDIVCAVEW